MIKKVKALFFIILAISNVNMLAHTLVPHHYHENKVCNEKFHCQTHSEAHTHHTADHNHEHDRKNNIDHCISDQVFVIRYDQAKLECKSQDFTDSWPNYNQFRASIPDSELITLVISNFFKTQPSLDYITYYQFVNSQLGMRAPPIV